MSKRCPGLFIEEIDWNDPRYAPWNIAEKLGDLSEAQLDAVWADDVCYDKEIHCIFFYFQLLACFITIGVIFMLNRNICILISCFIFRMSTFPR